MKRTDIMVVVGILMLMMVVAGCSTTGPTAKSGAKAVQKSAVGDSLRCVYKVGKTETVSRTSSVEHKAWIEMPDKDPSITGNNTVSRQIIARRKVESVAGDGSAIMKVTFESVKIRVKIDTKKTKGDYLYISNSESTKSYWAGEPKLAGVSYKIKIAPDTTVLEVIGLDELRKKLKLKPDSDRKVAPLVSEKGIKKFNQCEFVRFGPESVAVGDKYDGDVVLPDSTIKAQAINMKYQVVQPQAKNTITIAVSGEPLFVLPEGIAEPEPPTNPGIAMIKSMSDMNKLDISGTGVFDSKAGKVLKSDKVIDCTLILDGNKIFGGGKKGKKKADGGKMFTISILKDKYEVTE